MSVSRDRAEARGFTRYLAFVVVFGLGMLSGVLLDWQSPTSEAGAEHAHVGVHASEIATAADESEPVRRGRRIERDEPPAREEAALAPSRPSAHERQSGGAPSGAGEVEVTGAAPREIESSIAEELPHVKREAERVYALAAELPLPLQRHTYRVRGYRHGERFHSPKLGRLSSPRTVPLNRLSGGDVSPEQRESAQTRLWELERRRREVEVALYERQNELIAEYDSTREPLPRVEFFFSTDRGLYVIREGDDAEHGRLLRELREMDAAIDTFTSEFRRGAR